MQMFGVMYRKEDNLLFIPWTEGDFSNETLTFYDSDDMIYEILGEFNDSSLAITLVDEVEGGYRFVIKNQVDMEIDLRALDLSAIDQVRNFNDMITLYVSRFREQHGEHYGYTIH